MTTKELDNELNRIVVGESLFPRWQRNELKLLLLEARIDELSLLRKTYIWNDEVGDYLETRSAELKAQLDDV